MKMVDFLTQTAIRELIIYDPETGKAYWKERDIKWFSGKERICKTWNTRYANKEICCLRPDGYIKLAILDFSELLHRVIWLYMTGEWPDYVDHINGIRNDNRWENLRNVTQSLNLKNQKLSVANKSGITGVIKRRYGYEAYIKSEGAYFYLGKFKTLEEATAIRKKEEEKLNFHKNHGRNV